MSPSTKRNLVRVDDIAELAKVSGSHFRVVNPGLQGADPLLSGEFRQVQLRSGLTLHATDTREMHDLRTEAIQLPGLTVSLFLEGSVRAWFGGRPFEMGSRAAGPPRQIEAIAIARTRADQFARESTKGMHVRKVNVTVTPEWLENGGLAPLSGHSAATGFSRNHLASMRWTASARLTLVAQQLLRPPPLSPQLQALYCESRAIDMISEALQAMTEAPRTDASQGVHPVHLRRVHAACEFIEQHLNDELTLHTISQAAGLNPNSLQRVFRAVQGVTIFEYVRSRKLDGAREALERDNVSVGEAAYLAGYTSSANFATAFRRRFGVSPRQIRDRN